MNEIEEMFRQMGFEVSGGAILLTAIVLNRLGDLIKGIDSIPNKFIPMLVSFSGAGFYPCLVGFSFEHSAIGFGVGILTVGGYELFIAPFKKKDPNASQPANPDQSKGGQ